jgi:hypothetical protein
MRILSCLHFHTRLLLHKHLDYARNFLSLSPLYLLIRWILQRIQTSK